MIYIGTFPLISFFFSNDHNVVFIMIIIVSKKFDDIDSTPDQSSKTILGLLGIPLMYDFE